MTKSRASSKREVGGFGPLSPEAIGALVTNAFRDTKSLLLTGVEDGGIPVRESLRRSGMLIRGVEQPREEP